MEDRIAPVFREDLLLPGLCGFGCRRQSWPAGRLRVVFKAEFEDDRNGMLADCGCREQNVDIDGDLRVGRVIDMANEVLGHGGDAGVRALRGGNDLPVNRRCIGRDTSEVFVVKESDQLRTALRPPGFCGSDGLAIGEDQRIRKIGIRIGLGFVVIDRIGALAVMVNAGTQRGDMQRVQQTLMVLRGSEINGRRLRCCLC